MRAQNAQAHRMKCAAPDILCRFADERGKARFHFVCRFVCKCYREQVPRSAERRGKAREQLIGGHFISCSGTLKRLQLLLREGGWHERTEVRIAIAENECYPVYKYGSFTRARTCQHKERTVCCIYGFALFFIEK